jgi:hypothetical protein
MTAQVSASSSFRESGHRLPAVAIAHPIGDMPEQIAVGAASQQRADERWRPTRQPGRERSFTPAILAVASGAMLRVEACAMRDAFG